MTIDEAISLIEEGRKRMENLSEEQRFMLNHIVDYPDLIIVPNKKQGRG